MLFINNELPLNFLNGLQIDKIIIVGLYFLNSLYILFLVTKNKKELSYKNIIGLTFMALLLVNNLYFKFLVILLLVFFYIIDFKARPLKVSVETILILPLIVFVMSPLSNLGFYGTQIFLILTVIRIACRNSSELHVGLAFFLISISSLKYIDNVVLYYSLFSILTISYLKYELTQNHKERLFNRLEEIKIINKFLIKVEISNKKMLSFGKDQVPEPYVLKTKRKDFHVAHLTDSTSGFIFLFLLIGFALFLGIYS
jgi:hypothetical protein